jgi:hypothetical protein
MFLPVKQLPRDLKACRLLIDDDLMKPFIDNTMGDIRVGVSYIHTGPLLFHSHAESPSSYYIRDNPPPGPEILNSRHICRPADAIADRGVMGPGSGPSAGPIAAEARRSSARRHAALRVPGCIGMNSAT